MFGQADGMGLLSSLCAASIHKRVVPSEDDSGERLCGFDQSFKFFVRASVVIEEKEVRTDMLMIGTPGRNQAGTVFDHRCKGKFARGDVIFSRSDRCPVDGYLQVRNCIDMDMLTRCKPFRRIGNCKRMWADDIRHSGLVNDVVTPMDREQRFNAHCYFFRKEPMSNDGDPSGTLNGSVQSFTMQIGKRRYSASSGE
jgi:hypothetical protein